MDDHNTKKHHGRDDLAGEHKYGDSGQLILGVLFFVVLLLDWLWLGFSEPIREAVPWLIRAIVSIPIFLIALALFQLSHRTIFGTQRESLTVIDTSIYGFVRHPMYLAAILLYLAFLIVAMSILAGVVWVITIIFYYYISRYEEALLVRLLGDAYKDYQRSVPMFIPRLRRCR